jgi:alkylated DNA repair dioxygenase AlkB
VDVQASLFSSGLAPRPDATFSTLTRHDLDERSWVDHAPGWVEGADTLFEQLVAEAPWKQRERWMYERKVPEPRLTAAYGDDAPLPAELDGIRATLSARYGVEFDSVFLNLYRDGRDSVAWHGDRVARTVHHPLVATVSLGHPRRFLLRPKGGGRSVRFEPGPGDLIVMGGACQTEWDHTVPKAASAGPRISVTVRHSR